jgi:hypothetical protein
MISILSLISLLTSPDALLTISLNFCMKLCSKEKHLLDRAGYYGIKLTQYTAIF